MGGSALGAGKQPFRGAQGPRTRDSRVTLGKPNRRPESRPRDLRSTFFEPPTLNDHATAGGELADLVADRRSFGNRGRLELSGQLPQLPATVSAAFELFAAFTAGHDLAPLSAISLHPSHAQCPDLADDTRQPRPGGENRKATTSPFYQIRGGWSTRGGLAGDDPLGPGRLTRSAPGDKS